MATIDYKEKYEQALERAKDFMNGKVHYALKKGENIMCWVFPELCESEDERIRQLLIRFVKYDMSDNYSDDFTPADCVAWLEKQCERKSVEERQYTRKIIDTTTNEVIGYQTDDGLFTPETRPAWSEEDEKLVKNLISTLSNLYARNLIEKETKEKYTNLLKSLKDRVLPQQEWTEDDENKVTLFMQLVEGCDNYEELSNWLKSLRPQNRWKPSDEQMDALESAIVDSISSIQKHSLESLYNELKKLF